ncbi:MAG: DUF5700 domain-containing putative Zn-dependent protease [Candidatus Zixiibacteriota bacterium]
MRTVLFFLACAVVSSNLLSCYRESSKTAKQQVDFSAATALLDVLQASVDESPNCDSITDRLSSLPRQQRDALLDSLIAAKESKPALVRRIHALIESPAYRLYYRQFRNVKPDDHRRILLALPYEAIPSPADISRNLLEITVHLPSVRSWIKGLSSRIDLDTCRSIAERWLPDGEHEIPETFFIFDGNGDAFAHDGQVCFDLYSLVLARRSPDTRYEGLDTLSADGIEPVLAHEFHHIFAQPYFAPSRDEAADWTIRWRNRLIRRLVTEGTAMHCNPPEGFNRTIKEDTAVVVHWLRELDKMMALVKSGEVAEEVASDWLGNTYQEAARSVLRQYLSRTIPEDELEREVKAHEIDRPSLVYTLGWWMVSHISDKGFNPEAVHELIKHPLTLFERYNAKVSPGADSLKTHR